MDIYDIDGSKIVTGDVIGDLPVTKQCKHVEELMKSNHVIMSWEDTKQYQLSAGTYIIPFPDERNPYDGNDPRYPIKYRLFENYQPDCKDEVHYSYDPEFQHPVMWLSRIPLVLVTSGYTGWTEALKKTSWGYTGSPLHIAMFITDCINWLSNNYEEFGEVFGKGWYSVVDSDLAPSATINFESVDIMSGAGLIAQALDCEYHFDFARKEFRLGTISYGTKVTLKTGVNVGVADVSRTKKDFHNAFLVKGSTRNLSQPTNTGENMQVLERLMLNPEKYPDGIMYTDDSGNIIDRNQFLSLDVPMLMQELIFDDIYPTLELYLYNTRERKCWLLDNNGNKVPDENGELDPEDDTRYKSYSKWYTRLAYPLYETDSQGVKTLTGWKDYKLGAYSVFAKVAVIEARTKRHVSYTLDLDFSRSYFTTRAKAYPGPDERPAYVVRVMANGYTVTGAIHKDYYTDRCYIYSEYANYYEDDCDEANPEEMKGFAENLKIGDRVEFVFGVNPNEFPKDNVDGENSVIKGHNLGITFIPNYEQGAENSLLVGQGDFDAVYYDKDTQEHEDDDISSEPWQVQEGEYRIVQKESGNFIIPTTHKGGIYPLAEETPQLTNNKATLLNIVVDDVYKLQAQQDLEMVAKRKIKLLRSDLNNYTLPSDPNYFEQNNLRLHIGQHVEYDNGQDLAGGTSYVLDTHIIKIETQIDYPWEKEITVGNEKVKSNLTTLQDQVSTVVGGGSLGGGSGSGGGYTEQQLQQIIANYGAAFFISKTYDDSAAGNIEFKKDITVDGKTYSDEIISSEYTGDGMLDTGYRLWYEDGRAKLVIDDLVARGKFSVYELETRIMTHAGGDVVFSGAGSKIFYVEYLGDKQQVIDPNTGQPIIDPETGKPVMEERIIGYTTINSPWMLRGKMLLGGNTALAAWSNRKKIQKQLTDAEKAQVRKFRCYVVSDDGTTQTRNWWHTHDLARSQTFDHTQLKQTSEGYYSGTNVTNTVYWRRVAGIGSKEIEGIGDGKIHDYFDLWNVLDVSNEKYIDEHGQEQTIGYDIPSEEYTTPGYDASYNDWPAAGDDVVQFGNARDLDRQAMVTIEVTGGEPGIQIYNGVHTYNMAQTKWVGIGYDSTTKHAYSDVFGDFYFGERGTRDVHDGSTYVRYRMDDGTPQHKPRLDIKAHITAESTYGDDDLSLEDYILDITWTKEDIEEMIGEGVEVVQRQVDGNFIVWYGDVTPTLNNDPASGWHTEALKQEHLYDMYYDRVAKLGYRFVTYMDGGVEKYKWEQVRDISIISSLAAAENAQDTADNKRRVFICDYVTKMHPEPPYDEGDLWVNASYTSPITQEVIFDNDIVKCITAKPNEQSSSFDVHDWTIASKYTDDSSLNNFVNVTYSDDMARVHKQIDGKIDTFFTDTDPSTDWTAAQKEEHVDDVWFNTYTERLFRYKKTESGGLVSYVWDEIYDDVALQAYKDAAKAQDTADRKRRVFLNDPNDQDPDKRYPTPPYDKGDLWAQGITGDLMRCIIPRTTGDYHASDWEKASKYTDDSSLTTFVNDVYASFVSSIQTQVDGKAETWYQITDPSTNWSATKKTEHIGDIWHNASNQTISGVEAGQDAIWNGSSWDVSAVPQDVFDKIDGKADIFVTRPTTYNQSDMWIIESGLSSDYMPSGCQSGDIVISSQNRTNNYNKADWTKKDRYTDDTAFNAYINEVINGTGASGDAKTVADAARVLNGALKAKTEMDGGLMLTSTLVMRKKNDDDTYTTWGGLNGVHTSDTAIAAWFGGGMIDHEESPSATGYATSLFRMNGSGYVAGGNITWDKNGVVTVKSTNFSTEHFCIDGVEIFQLENVGTVENPHYRIKAFYDFYSVGGISALGAGDGGEQPSYNIFLSQLRDVDTEGVEEGQVLMREGTKWVPRSVGSTTSIATLSDVDVENVQNGDALVFNSTQRKWVPGTGGVNMSTIWAALAEAGEQPINHSHIAAALDGYAHTSDIPTDNNQLNNGAGYITSSGSCSYASSAGSAGYATSAGSATSATTAGSAGYATSAGSAGTAGAGTSPFYINADSGNPRLIMHAPNRFWGNMCVKSNQEFYFYKNNDESTPTCVNADWFYAYSKVTALSDARKKDIVGDIDLTVEQVANAPAVKFYWKDKRDNDLHVGSIAQYWQPILPETVYEKNDELSMDYSVIGLSAAKVVAKRVVDQGQEIKELKEELKEKGQEIKDLKSELRDIKEMLNQILKGHGSR